MLLWQRPADVPLGQVWRRFKGRERNGIPAKCYQVRDMEDKHKDRCLRLMLETFMRDEPLVRALEVNEDPESVSTIQSNWLQYMEQNVCLACFTEEDGEPLDLVGFNILLVKTVDEEEEDIELVKGEPWKKLLKTLVAAEQLVNVFEHYDVDKFLTSSGLTVLPEHRGQNIGAQIFAARKPLCKALGIEATATVFTAVTSQVLAAKCGYELLGELPYEDMKSQDIDLSQCDTPTAKLMGTKFDFSVK